MAAPTVPVAATTTIKNLSTRALASAALRVNGYEALPGSILTPPRTDPYWYDEYSPTQLWSHHLSSVTKHEVIQPVQLRANSTHETIPPKPDGHLRFVCISDTHMHHNNIPLPPTADLGIDVLLHAGDFTNLGEVHDVDRFTQWIRDLKIKFKVVIAGNHDLSFDEGEYAKTLARRFSHRFLLDPKKIKADLIAGSNQPTSTEENPFPEVGEAGGTFYLEDQGLSIHGIRIWGSPWQPEFHDWGFNLVRGEPLRQKWDMIPSNTQVLMTHGPPIGHGDDCLPDHQRAGCVDLLMQIQNRIKPRYHIYGHIHEGYGQTSNGVTDFINASTCNSRYDGKNLNPPIIFDLPINVKENSEKAQK